MSYLTYAVRILKGEKHRFFIGAYTTESEAKHMANCAVSGNASYAYVKDTHGGTVFYLKSDQYQEVPVQPEANHLLPKQGDEVRLFAPDQKLPSHILQKLLDTKW